MTNAPRFARLARRIGRTPIGKAALVRAYWAAAEGAAQLLLRVPGVDGVYASGSLRDPHRLRPGYSDIDLVAVVDVATLEDELELRRGFRRVLGLVNVAGPLFKHLDYVERRDLEFLRRLGNAWSLSADSAWELLAGANRLEPGIHAGHEKRRLERLIAALRRWQDTSSFLLDGGGGRAPTLNAIGAERTLAEVLAAWLDMPRFTPLTSLLEAARPRAQEFDALKALARTSERKAAGADDNVVRERVVASLEVLSAFASEVTLGWSGEWPREALTMTAASKRSAPRMSSAGRPLSASYLVEDHYGEDVPLVVAAPGASARHAVTSLERLLEVRRADAALRVTPRPTVLTNSLWHAAALLDSPPFTGAELALAGRLQWGEPRPAPPSPVGQAWDDLVVGRAVQLFWRPRGRGLRVEVSPARALEKARHEVFVHGSALAALLGVSKLDLADTSSRVDESTLIEKHRSLLAALRPAFVERLRRR